MKVGAFYYIWYGAPAGGYGSSHWSDNTYNIVVFEPRLGYYRSSDPTIIDQHIQWAKEAGIDFFLASWWSDQPYMTTNMGLLLERCVASQFQTAVMIEGHTGGDTAAWQADADHVYANWASSPAYFQHDAKPLLALYPTDQTRGTYTDARFTLRWLIGGTLTLAADEWGYWWDPPQQWGNGEQSSVIPGFDNRGLMRSGARPSDYKYRSLATYEDYWRIVRGYAPQIVLICSFNEWHEGTSIEPCDEWGTEFIEATKRLGGWYQSP